MSEVVEELNVEETEVVEEESTEEQKVSTEEVKSKGQQIDVEALKKEFIEMVRKEEKDKLYKSMEKTKEELKAERDAKTALEAKIKEYEEKNLSAEEKTALKLEELAKANAELKEALDRVSLTAAQEIHNIQLEAAKAKVLAQYGEEIVPELILGSTIEEITESAERAHETYKRITEKATQKLTQERRETGTTGNIAPKTNETNKMYDVDINKVNDPAEWQKVKADILRKAGIVL